MNQELFTASERLCAFLDGELHGSDVGNLFYELAQNSDLQEEMRQHISLRKMFKGNVVAPPSNLKNKILIGAGIGAGLTAPFVSPTSFGVADFFTKFLGSRIFAIVGSTVVSALTTALIISSVGKDDKISNQMVQNNALPNQELVSSIPVKKLATETKPITTNKISKSTRKTSFSLPSYLFIAGIPSIPDNVQAQPVQQPEPEFNSNKNFSEIRTSNVNSVVQPLKSHEIFSIVTQTNNSNDRYLKTKAQNYSLNIRKMAQGSIPDVNIVPYNEPIINNLAINLMYKINDNHSMGIEIGQEDLMQKFHGKESDGHEYGYNQAYVAFWTGFSYQYTGSPVKPYDKYFDMRPFIHALIAGTRIGPYIKESVGLELFISDNLLFSLGIEHGLLLYKYQENYFSTNKLGLTYGFSVKF
ncbi:MAG: hypothetical protein NT007_07160 [Candidatus Kapabacteria bacterium]|nr:hypothetical protein [Candidatus Kapabacteria bacterium]